MHIVCFYVEVCHLMQCFILPLKLLDAIVSTKVRITSPQSAKEILIFKFDTS